MTNLYLDIDGVLNVFDRTGDNPAWPDPYAEGRAQGHLIVWSPALIEELHFVLNTGVDLVWTTTWRQHALDDIAPLVGLPATRFITANEKFSDSSTIQWKTRAVLADQDSDPSSFIWVDDDHDQFSMRHAEDRNGLAIQTDARLGITPGQVAEMHGYLESLRRRDLGYPV